MGGLDTPIQLPSHNSVEAFELKERSRNLIIQTHELRTIIVIESITKKGGHKTLPKNDPKCRVYQAIMNKKNYEITEDEEVKIPSSILYIAAQGIKDNEKETENLLEVTIINYKGQILLSTVVSPRQYVPFNESHTGFPEDEMTQGKDEILVLENIKRLVMQKVIVCYGALNIFRICSISTSLTNDFVDLERSEPLRRRMGNQMGKIALSTMAKKCNIPWKVPMRTPRICKVIQQLWSMVENYTINFMEIQINHSEHETLQLQDQMDEEFQEPVITQIQEAPSRKTTKINPSTLQIQTSPLKRLRITEDNEIEQIPLLNLVQKKFRVDQTQSNFPKNCIINGEEYTIQAIIASPVKQASKPILCQLLTLPHSQGREDLKGGRNVEVHQEEEPQN